MIVDVPKPTDFFDSGLSFLNLAWDAAIRLALDHDEWEVGKVEFGDESTDDERVIVVGPEKLAELTIDAGLVTWLIRKVA